MGVELLLILGGVFAISCVVVCPPRRKDSEGPDPMTTPNLASKKPNRQRQLSKAHPRDSGRRSIA